MSREALPPHLVALLDRAATDVHARAALRAYATSVRTENLPLARQIIDLILDLPQEHL